MSPKPAICAEKQRLLSKFLACVSDCNRMQTAQIAAVQKGADFPFESEIAAARDQRDQAKYALLAHQQEHGC